MQGVLLTVGNDDERTIQSCLTDGGERDQGLPTREGQGHQDSGGYNDQQGTTPVHHGGIIAKIQSMLSRAATATIMRELDWQGRVEGDVAKCTAFKDQCLSQSTFQAFAFMKGRSPIVRMANSIG
jgi:hypothetical protein